MTIKIDPKIILPASIATGCVALILLLAFVYAPLITKINKMRGENVSAASEVNFAKGIIASRPSSGAVSAQLISKNKTALIMDAISRLGSQNDIELSFVKPSSLSKEQNPLFRRVLLEVETSGSFKNLGKFLTQARDIPEGLVDVETFNLSADKADPKRVTAKIVFSVYITQAD